MKLISWNVNGLRACLGKGFGDYFAAQGADFFCLQETKMQPGQAEIPAEGYHQYFYSAEKKGYSGTAILTKHEPLSVAYGMGSELHDHEGRLITLEYEHFYLVTCYTPNSQRELTRLQYRMCWEEDFRMYLKKLDEKKPVIVCGDLNVAHKEIDLKNPKTNQSNAGFTPQERAATRSAICIRTSPAHTAGGAICSPRVRRTQAGASTTSWFPSALQTELRWQKSTAM